MLLISYEKDGQARQKVYDLNTSNVINKLSLKKEILAEDIVFKYIKCY